MAFDDAWLASHNAKMAALRAGLASSPIPANDGPAEAKARTSRRDDEFPIQCAIADFLDLSLPPPLRWLHIPNGEARGKRAAGRLKAMGLKPGAADVLILGHSPFIWIEVKTPIGKLSKVQKDWRDWCIALGAPWFLCRSIDDVAEALESLGIRLIGRLK